MKEYNICPVCGTRLAYINVPNSNVRYKICPDSTCRVQIKDDKINILDMDIYSRIQSNLNLEVKKNSGDRKFMLLKEDLSAPLLVKNTNDALSKTRNKYCIIRATDLDDAKRQFNQQFKYVKIRDEMIVEIEIKEI
jgi:hypothetical protein